MATTVQTRATSGRRPAEPDATRRTAFVGGFFYVLTFASSIVALLLIKPAVDDASYIVSGGADTRVLWGCFLDLVNAFAGVGSAVALYSVVKRQHEGFALGFVTTRIYEMAVIMIGVVSLFAVVTLRQEGVTGADSTSLVTAGRTLVAVRDWSFLLGPGFVAGLNALLLGTLLYRSRLVPRVIPTMGLVGAPIFLTSSIATIVGATEMGSIWSPAGAPVALIFVWELSLGIYLMVKGFKPSAITAEDLAA